jgi:hypothetical protein
MKTAENDSILHKYWKAFSLSLVWLYQVTTGNVSELSYSFLAEFEDER